MLGGIMILYESDALKNAIGDALRPGGFQLTDRSLDFCKFQSGETLLDLGCGRGATINYINSKYDYKICGLDISEKLISYARSINKDNEIILSSADNILYENEFFHGVIAECTLSLMEGIQEVFKEVNRVLKKNGYFIITDVYAKNTEYLEELKKFEINTCLKNPLDLNILKEFLSNRGFNVVLEERHDNMIIQLVADIIFNGCSTTSLCIDRKMKDLLIKSKIGYMLMIAQKK